METQGREWLRVTPRSTSSWATGLDVVDVPGFVGPISPLRGKVIYPKCPTSA